MNPQTFASFLALSVLLSGSAAAQTVTVHEQADIHGRPGWVIENGRIHVALLRGGGHIAEIRFVADDPKLAINPMFVPAGNGYMGHMVCFPNFGPASADERQSGIGGHGEANAVDWHQTKPPATDASGGFTFFYGADLPKTQYRIERAVSLTPGGSVIHVEESFENLTAFDRPYNLDEHATFGAPFVAPGKTFLDVSGSRGMTDPRRTAGGQWAVSREFTWPNAPKSEGGGAIDLRPFHAAPAGQAYTVIAADPSRPTAWFTMYNADYRLLVGYVFSVADHPWIIDWQNQPRTDSPAGTARGIEFGTSPWDEGLRKSVERAQMFDTPTYRFIGARQRLSTSFTVFLAEIPAGFEGVKDVEAAGGRMVVVGRGGSQRIPVRP